MKLRINNSYYHQKNTRIDELKKKEASLKSKNFFWSIIIGFIATGIFSYSAWKLYYKPDDFTVLAIVVISMFGATICSIIWSLLFLLFSNKLRIINEEYRLAVNEKERIEKLAIESYIRSNINGSAPKDLLDFVMNGPFEFH